MLALDLLFDEIEDAMHAAARLPSFRPPYGIIYLTSRVRAGRVVRRYIGQHKVYGGIIDDGYLGSGRLMTQAIKKHGRDSFVREVLQLCYSRKELDAAEYEWVKKFNAVADPAFYNLVDGGSTNNGVFLKKKVFNFSLSGELLGVYDSVAEAARVAGCSEAQMTFACKGTATRTRTAKGTVWSFSPEPIAGTVRVGVDRKVYCYTMDGDFVKGFTSLTKGARFIGERSTANVASCAKGKKRSAGGYLWSYEKADRVKKPHPVNKGQMKVRQIDPWTKQTVAVFDSHVDAAKAVGASPANISRSTRSHFKTMGYFWESV